MYRNDVPPAPPARRSIPDPTSTFVSIDFLAPLAEPLWPIPAIRPEMGIFSDEGSPSLRPAEVLAGLGRNFSKHCGRPRNRRGDKEASR